MLIADLGTSLWFVAYLERIILLYAALLLAAYNEYKLLYIPLDVVPIVPELGMAMEVAIGSHANVSEVL